MNSGTETSEELQVRQREVQRHLGRCLLRLQQYERLMKAIVAHHEISGPVTALEAIRTARIDDVATKTLGGLVAQLFGSYVVTESDSDEGLEKSTAGEVATVRMRLQLCMGTEDHERTQRDLRDLVTLRNGLVHHFIDAHDLWTEQGCREAQGALVAAYTRIDQHFEQLRGRAEHMDQVRRLAAEFVQSSVFHDLVVNGIEPDGSIDWSTSGIVRALREAMVELAVNGWTSVAVAGRFVQDRYPDQVPAKYGCGSWRQVVHECRLFELRYREVDGQRAGYYRERSG